MSSTSAPGAELYPAFLKLAGRKVVIVGGGPVAAGKLAALRAAGAHIVVIAPSIVPGIEAPTNRESRIPNPVVIRRVFVPADLDDAWYVVAAATPDVNRAVAAAAHARRLFVNAVDDPTHATAYLGGVLRRSGVTVAVSTGGDAPALAGLLREALEVVLPDDLDRWIDVARSARRQWKSEDVAMASRRPMLLDALNSLYGPSASPESAP